ncbi:hypothetical protein CJ306_30925 (plasmid) [Bacillus cereus]|nr:hypothetical protein CJ306_30925 [Bacillus cereus]
MFTINYGFVVFCLNFITNQHQFANTLFVDKRELQTSVCNIYKVPIVMLIMEIDSSSTFTFIEKGR